MTVIGAKKDRYGRILGQVTLDGRGMARFYRYYAKAYERAEIAAKEEHAHL